MNDIVFVAACFPEEKLNRLIEENDIDDIAANVFGQKICRCLASFSSSVDVINEHKNVRFPKQRKIRIHPSEDVDGNIFYHSYGYLNVAYFERWSKEKKIKRLLKRIQPRMVVVYSMHTPFLRPVIRLQKKLGYKSVLVVPDLPEYMTVRRYLLLRILKNYDIKVLYRLARNVNGFIVLTSSMKERLHTDGKRVLVLEGIADEVVDGEEDNQTRGNYILYSGSVSKMYGLPEFVEHYIEAGINEELYICGDGSYVTELKEVIKYNSKIRYLGVKKRDELHELQRKASLLVNPRSSNDEYTQYSFPSKTMEYLSSGTPVMMERLKGIPEEYYEYIIEVKGDWVSALKRFSSGEKDAYNERAKRGKEFIRNKKTISEQSKTIRHFIEAIYEGTESKESY